jgi:hypothetical protein
MSSDAIPPRGVTGNVRPGHEPLVEGCRHHVLTHGHVRTAAHRSTPSIEPRRPPAKGARLSSQRGGSLSEVIVKLDTDGPWANALRPLQDSGETGVHERRGMFIA